MPLPAGESAAEFSETCIPNAKAGTRHIASPMEPVLQNCPEESLISLCCDMLKLPQSWGVTPAFDALFGFAEALSKISTTSVLD